jgi:predicted nucleic acid-binding protein
MALDAWAVLAFLQREEPAATQVKAALERALRGEAELYLSIINAGEVVYRVGRARGEAEARQTFEQLRRLPLTLLPATEEAVLAAAALKMRHAISYADAFAAGAALAQDATLLTGDPELLALAGEVRLARLSRRGEG